MQTATAGISIGEVEQREEITVETQEDITPVTVVIAFPGETCIVVASDTYGFVGDESGYVGYQCRKIAAFANRWIIGTATTNIGSTLLSRFADEDFEGDYGTVLDRCRAKTKRLYSEHGYTAATSFLFCGLRDATPAISSWHLPKDPGGRTIEGVAEAIGVTGYGLQLANAYLDRRMSEEQLKLLALFCVQSLAAQELRVRGPFQMGIVTKAGAHIVPTSELTSYAEEAEKIRKSIRARFLLSHS